MNCIPGMFSKKYPVRISPDNSINLNGLMSSFHEKNLSSFSKRFLKIMPYLLNNNLTFSFFTSSLSRGSISSIVELFFIMYQLPESGRVDFHLLNDIFRDKLF